MLLSLEEKQDLALRYRTMDQIQREIVSCGALAGMCAEKGQIAGVLYWQSCATHLRALAAAKTQSITPMKGRSIKVL